MIARANEIINLTSDSEVSNIVNDRIKKEELGNYELYTDLGEVQRKRNRRNLKKKIKDEIMASRLSSQRS